MGEAAHEANENPVVRDFSNQFATIEGRLRAKRASGSRALYKKEQETQIALLLTALREHQDEDAVGGILGEVDRILSSEITHHDDQHYPPPGASAAEAPGYEAISYTNDFYKQLFLRLFSLLHPDADASADGGDSEDSMVADFTDTKTAIAAVVSNLTASNINTDTFQTARSQYSSQSDKAVRAVLSALENSESWPTIGRILGEAEKAICQNSGSSNEITQIKLTDFYQRVLLKLRPLLQRIPGAINPGAPEIPAGALTA